MRRLVIPLGIVFIVLVIAGMGYLGFRSTQAGPSTPAAPQTVTVARGDVQRTVTAPGQLVGTRQATLAFGVGGRLAQIDVQPGDRVQAGDVLAKLDTADLELQVAEAEQTYLKQQANYSVTIKPDPKAVTAAQAAVTSANAAYEAARQQYDLRDKQLMVNCLNFKNASDALARAQAAYDSVANDWKAKNYRIFTVRQQALEDAQAAYDLAKAQCGLNTTDMNDAGVASALAQLTQARANLDALVAPSSATVLQAQAQMEQARLALEDARQQLTSATIVAPFDGVVLEVNANLGDALAAHSSMIVLTDPTAVEVQSTVIEEDLPTVQVGQPVNLYFDAQPGAATTGKVDRIVPARAPGDRLLYTVYLSVDELPPGLVAGMTVDGSIVVATQSNVLRLPRELVRVRSDGSALVKVWAGDHVEQRTITVGLQGDSFDEVLDGLQAGEQVVSE